MTNTLVTLLARHLHLDADSGASPDRMPDNLEDKPNFQQIATIDRPHIKRLYALFTAARERARLIGSLLPNPDANHPVMMRPHGLLAASLMLLFEREVCLRFCIPDDCNIIVDRRWRVFSYSSPTSDCDGNCSDCSQEECSQRSEDAGGHDCGPNCKSLGGPGCGRPDCTCEEPKEPVERLDISVGLDKETFVDLKAVGVCLAGMLPAEKLLCGADVTTKFGINEPMYRAMKKVLPILARLTEMCEQKNGWSFEPEPDKG